jgi:hypothetical protein
LCLDIYNWKENRKGEFLAIYFELKDPKTARDEKQKMVQSIRAKRFIELINEEQGFPTRLNAQMNFVEYYQSLMERRIHSYSTSIPNLKTVFNRQIKMNGIVTEGNSGVILVFLGNKSQAMQSFIFNKQRTFYYKGKVIENSQGSL